MRDDAVAGVGDAGVDAEDDHVHAGDSPPRAGRLPRLGPRIGACLGPGIRAKSPPGWSAMTLTGARGRPARTAIEGERVRLEPLDPARHAADLFAAAQGDDALWDYLPYGPFADVPALTAHLRAAGRVRRPALLRGRRRRRRASGIVSYLRIEPVHGCIEIGHIWFGAPLQRTPAATEAIYLLAREAFDGLGNRRFEWKCNAANERSRRAAERFGFTLRGRLPPAHDRQGRQPRHRLVLDPRRRVAGRAQRVRDLAGPVELRRPGGRQRQTLASVRGQ